MASFVVFTVKERNRFTGKYGEMVSYDVQFRDSNGEYVEAEWAKKADSPPPAEGETVEGTVEDNPPHGKRFKKANTGPMGGGRARSPKENAQIVHQAALKVAIQYVAAKVQLGKLEDFTPEDVNKIATAFRGYVEKVDV